MGHGYVVVLNNRFERHHDLNGPVKHHYTEVWIVQVDLRALRIEAVTAAMHGKAAPDAISYVDDVRVKRKIKMVGELLRRTVKPQQTIMPRDIINPTFGTDLIRLLARANAKAKRLQKKRKT